MICTNVSQEVSTIYLSKLTQLQYITHNCIIFNTPSLQYIVQCYRSYAMLLERKNMFLIRRQATSYAPSSVTLSQWQNYSLFKASSRGPNRWRSDRARSGLHAYCSKIPKCNCWSVSTVWGWALSCISTVTVLYLGLTFRRATYNRTVLRRFPSPHFRAVIILLIIKIIKIIMFLGSKVRLVRRADNLTAIYEPIV
jgi:hypothetical protein